jgi:hypothetical protein
MFRSIVLPVDLLSMLHKPKGHGEIPAKYLHEVCLHREGAWPELKHARPTVMQHNVDFGLLLGRDWLLAAKCLAEEIK